MQNGKKKEVRQRLLGLHLQHVVIEVGVSRLLVQRGRLVEAQPRLLQLDVHQTELPLVDGMEGKASSNLTFYLHISPKCGITYMFVLGR